MGFAFKMNFILSRHAAAVQDSIDAELQGQYTSTRKYSSAPRNRARHSRFRTRWCDRILKNRVHQGTNSISGRSP